MVGHKAKDQSISFWLQYGFGSGSGIFGAILPSDVSAVSDSDAGDQYWCSIRSWQIFRISLMFHLSPHAADIQYMNVFLCLPLARLPSIIPVSATASNWFFYITWPTNRICLLTITFRRFIDVLALWRTWSLVTLSVRVIRNHCDIGSCRD